MPKTPKAPPSPLMPPPTQELENVSNESNDDRYCGFIAVIGAPNVGKSTLVNRLTGSKISIVTAKPQTTRNRILGLVIEGTTQMILVDTPGFFQPRSGLDRAMVATARRSIAEADLVMLMVDATADLDRAKGVLGEVADHGPPTMLVLNKTDRVARPSLLALAQSLNHRLHFAETFMISALSGDGVEAMTQEMAAALPPGPWLFPPDQITDAPQRLLASELTREQIFLQLRQELPYKTAVETESWQEYANGDLRLQQVVIVERQSQKKIIIGKKGDRLKKIGAAARHQIAETFGRRVHLFLHVTLRPGWREDRRFLRALGFDRLAAFGIVGFFLLMVFMGTPITG